MIVIENSKTLRTKNLENPRAGSLWRSTCVEPVRMTVRQHATGLTLDPQDAKTWPFGSRSNFTSFVDSYEMSKLEMSCKGKTRAWFVQKDTMARHWLRLGNNWQQITKDSWINTQESVEQAGFSIRRARVLAFRSLKKHKTWHLEPCIIYFDSNTSDLQHSKKNHEYQRRWLPRARIQRNDHSK